MIDAVEEEEHQKYPEKEEKDEELASDSAGKIRFADLEEDENHTNGDNVVEDEVEDEQIET